MRYKHQLIIAFVGLINVFLHLLPSVNFEYHRDELLYFSLVNHLDFGYATTPPLIGLMAFISKSLFGYSVFSIRLFPALFSGLLVYLTSMIAKELNGNFRSQLISAIGVVGTTFVSMIYGVFTPYFIDIFLWTLVIYLLIKFAKTNSDNYLLVLGIAMGLSFLNKYSIIFLIVSAFVVLPFTKYRYIFSNKFFYWALLLSVLIASPNIIWQIYYHFPVLNHMKELNESQLANVNRLEFVVGQFILLLPFTFVILPGIVFFIVNKQFSELKFQSGLAA
jgi:4-amino-4-deoxy-L-arabinose transferase-like glycosyltransferase